MNDRQNEIKLEQIRESLGFQENNIENREEILKKEEDEKNEIKNDKIYPKISKRNEDGKLIMDSLKLKDKSIQGINDVLNNLKLLKSADEDMISIIKENEMFFKKKKYILTDGSCKRIAHLIYCIENKLNALLEGPTGTSKTFSVQIANDFINYLNEKENEKKPIGERKPKQEFIRFNLSSETKIDNLLSQYVGDPNSPAGLKLIEGKFFTAFTKGYTFLLDEINLASKSVLCALQEAIGSGMLSIQISGKGLCTFKKHENFVLIATQNPNKGAFKGKRQDLGIDFLSRFCKVNFEIDVNELKEISLGLSKEFGFIKENMDDITKINKEKTIENLVDFHINWIKNYVPSDDVQCFTIREIAATVKAISDPKNSIFECIYNIYGARYQKAKKEKLLKVLKNYTYLNDEIKKTISLDPEFKFCFSNNNLLTTINQSLFSLNTGRNIIITSKRGNGRSEVAKMVSLYYNYQNKHFQKDEFFCICTEKVEPSDLIGCQKAADKIQEGGEMLVWKDGFLTKAISCGLSIVLDNIEEAPATVTERLNGLLDKNYSEEDFDFDIPENPKKSSIKINSQFRLICTCEINNINKMSPAFVNRFDVIVLEDQLESITDKDLLELTAVRLAIENENENKNIQHFNEIKANDKDDDSLSECGHDDSENTENENEEEEDNLSNDSLMIKKKKKRM